MSPSKGESSCMLGVFQWHHLDKVKIRDEISLSSSHSREISASQPKNWPLSAVRCDLFLLPFSKHSSYTKKAFLLKILISFENFIFFWNLNSLMSYSAWGQSPSRCSFSELEFSPFMEEMNEWSRHLSILGSGRLSRSSFLSTLWVRVLQ